jgi:hypothetical protein
MNLLRCQPVIVLALALAGGPAVLAQPTNVPGPTDYAALSGFIASRNIFDPDRRPRTGSTPRVTRDKVVESFSLVGTMKYEKGLFAFFDGTSSKFKKALETAGEIAGFKIAGVKSDSVTLVSDTNEIVLKINTQMRREEGGDWSLVAEAGSYSGNSRSESSGSRNSSRFAGLSESRNNFSGRPASPDTGSSGPETVVNGSIAAPPDQADAPEDGAPPQETPSFEPSGNAANDALRRLMELRAQEAQQLQR